MRVESDGGPFQIADKRFRLPGTVLRGWCLACEHEWEVGAVLTVTLALAEDPS